MLKFSQIADGACQRCAARGLGIDNIKALCRYLDCKPCDLIELVSD